MFCPKCRAEYREGFDTCADCQVPLVEELVPEPEAEFHDFSGLMTVFDESQIAVIRSLFDDAGLVYFFQGELSRHLVPLPFSKQSDGERGPREQGRVYSQGTGSGGD